MSSETDYKYLLERSGILSTAVGIARLHLQDGDTVAALAVLDKASNECHHLLFDALVDEGFAIERVEVLIGPKRESE